MSAWRKFTTYFEDHQRPSTPMEILLTGALIVALVGIVVYFF